MDSFTIASSFARFEFKIKISIVNFKLTDKIYT
jgi:hypothetical protein